MTDKELFIHTVEDELPRFERVFKAIPKDHRDYRPDPKSKTAIELASGMASEADMLIDFLTKGEYDFVNYKPVSGMEPDALAALFAKGLTAVKEQAIKMSDADWAKDARMLMNGKEEWKVGRGLMVFALLLDLIHHRGQLATYLRPMGGKVPSIYGPSADSA